MRAGEGDVVLYPELRAVVRCKIELSAQVWVEGIDPHRAEVDCGPIADLRDTEFGASSLWHRGERVADGVFKFSLLPPERELFLKAEAGACIGIMSLPPLRNGERREVELVLKKRGVLHRTVTDLQGNAVPRAQLIARPLAKGVVKETAVTYTDEQGEFTLGRLVPGPCSVEVSASGLDRARLEVEVREGENHPLPRISLGLPAEVHGRVVLPDGRACRGAVIRAVDYSQNLPSSYRGDGGGPKARSGSDGQFRLVLPTGTVTLVAEAREFARSIPLSLDLHSGETLERVTLSLRKGTVISGRVVDQRGSGARVLLILEYEDGSLADFSSGADGGGEAHMLPAGMARLRAVVSGETIGEIDVDVAPDRGDGIELRVTVPWKE